MSNKTDTLEKINLIKIRIKELQDIIPKIAFTHKHSYEVLRDELAQQKSQLQDEISFAKQMGWL